MQPIQELLNRIKWDPAFGKGTFELGIYDRVKDAIVRTQLSEITEDQDNKGQLIMLGDDELEHTVPHHRIREVYKDGFLIWQRPE